MTTLYNSDGYSIDGYFAIDPIIVVITFPPRATNLVAPSR